MSACRGERRPGQGGFSLVEVLTVVAIMGFLAAIAIPGYRGQMRKARRASAKAALVDAAQTLERFMTRNGTYVGGAVTPAATEGETYQLSFLLGPTATTYTIQAVPQGAQATDGCGALTLDQAGVRAALGPEPDGCW